MSELLEDFYAVLGVSLTATSAEIKKAYQRLALRHHPDRKPKSEKVAATAKFQQIGDAYCVLSDEYKRAQYDIIREEYAEFFDTPASAEPEPEPEPQPEPSTEAYAEEVFDDPEPEYYDEGPVYQYQSEEPPARTARYSPQVWQDAPTPRLRQPSPPARPASTRPPPRPRQQSPPPRPASTRPLQRQSNSGPVTLTGPAPEMDAFALFESVMGGALDESLISGASEPPKLKAREIPHSPPANTLNRPQSRALPQSSPPRAAPQSSPPRAPPQFSLPRAPSQPGLPRAPSQPSLPRASSQTSLPRPASQPPPPASAPAARGRPTVRRVRARGTASGNPSTRPSAPRERSDELPDEPASPVRSSAEATRGDSTRARGRGTRVRVRGRGRGRGAPAGGGGGRESPEAVDSEYGQVATSTRPVYQKPVDDWMAMSSFAPSPGFNAGFGGWSSVPPPASSLDSDAGAFARSEGSFHRTTSVSLDEFFNRH